MNASAPQPNRNRVSPATTPADRHDGKVEGQKQQFRRTIEPLLYRARQLGLSRVQIREVIMSLL